MEKKSLDYELEIAQYRFLLAGLRGYLAACVELNSPMPVKVAKEYNDEIKELLEKYS